MTSQNFINYDNFVAIKQEAEPVYNQPVVVQNAVFLPEFNHPQSFKSEPEENYCMEVDNQNYESCGTNVNTGIIANERSSGGNFLKISSVTQRYNLSNEKTTKGGRKPKAKNVEDLKVTTKMKPPKNVKNIQKVIKGAPKLDKNIQNSRKVQKIGRNFEDSVIKVGEFPGNLRQFGEKIDSIGQQIGSNVVNLEEIYGNSGEYIGIFGESYETFTEKPRKITKSSQKSANKPKKPSQIASKLTKPIKAATTSRKSSKTLKITNFFDFEDKLDSNLGSYKIPIEKSQRSPTKTSKNAKTNLKISQSNINITKLNLKSQQSSLKKQIKTEDSSQNLQSSFIVDDKNATQIKLKISKPNTKSLEKEEKIKKPRQQKKLNEHNLKNSTNSLQIKQESLNNSIIKSEPEIPTHFSLQEDFQLQLIDYEPKIMKKRKEIRLECDNCDKVFKSKYSIIWHMKEHMLTMPFNCNICGKGFSYERSFRQHELSHAAKVKCEICGKSLKPHAMYYHMKYRHTNEKTHKCPVCPKSFKTKDNIARHMMRHNMEFPCTICGRKFPENSRLQMHLNMHENPEAFFCSICNKSFEHIDRHMKRLHAQKRERNLKCQYCEYASDSKQTMKRHEEMHEKRNEILKSKTRKRKIKLKIIEMKTFECKICNVILQTKSGYKSHLRHYHKGKDQVKAILANEVKDESSMESDNFVEIKVEKEEISVIQ